jgi:hypothetical protein
LGLQIYLKKFFFKLQEPEHLRKKGASAPLLTCNGLFLPRYLFQRGIGVAATFSIGTIEPFSGLFVPGFSIFARGLAS